MSPNEVPVLNARDAARSFTEVVNRVAYAGSRVVLARRGVPIVAIVPVADLARLQAFDSALEPRPSEVLELLGAAPSTKTMPSEKEPTP